MSKNEPVEIKASPHFEETITLKQNGFSNGKVITFIEELKLKLDEGWQTKAKRELARVHNMNFDLQQNNDKKVAEEQ